MPLLQVKSDVISDGLLVVAAVADAAAPRLARSSEGKRMAAARHNLDGMVCLPLSGCFGLGSERDEREPAGGPRGPNEGNRAVRDDRSCLTCREA